MKSPALRALAVVVSAGLFILAITRAQLGCATADQSVAPDTPLANATATASPPSEPAASEAATDENVPAATAEPQASPTATASAADSADPTWFPASKAGGFIHMRGDKGKGKGQHKPSPNPPANQAPNQK